MTDPTLTRLRLLEDALRALGINPDADPLVTATRWTVERDADRRERSKAEAGAAALQNRLTDEMDRRRDAEQALAKMTDAHAVVSQRLVGSQKEVSEVTHDHAAREISRLSGLLDVFAAPVTFGERRLSIVERAEWALRRALRERDECAPRMAQLIDAEVCLDVLGVPAYAAVPGDDPGDASEALTVPERLRLHFGARKDP